MTLREIVAAVQGAFGARFQNSKTLVLQYLNTIQQIAFNRDLKAFLWWNNYLTIYQDVVLSSSGFTPFVAGDVTKTISDGTVTGTIISFNNDLYTVQVNTSGTFSGALTTPTGTGRGTFSSQAVSKGPYSWAGLTPGFGSLTPYTAGAYTAAGGVRRMLGITRATESELYTPNSFALTLDYNFTAVAFDERSILVNVHKYDMQRVIFFIDTPDTTPGAYRWVYYIRPPTIGLETDDVNVLIPPEYHQTVLVEGAGLLADRSTYGDKTPEQVIAQVLEAFWGGTLQTYTPNGANNNFTSEGQL